jgi:hypothetical protein
MANTAKFDLVILGSGSTAFAAISFHESAKVMAQA